MVIRLAGFNIDSAVMDTIPESSKPLVTPETFSAAYARISRSSKDISKLREQARLDVQKARKSNKTIIFKMGHHSVAEHAVFNFDIIGVSRLALEEIEKFRLVSYTEKSQRYVTLKGDFTLPAKIKDKKLKTLFLTTIKLQNEFYQQAYSVLKEYFYNKDPRLSGEKHKKSLLDGWAKEDSRYILSLATEGQVGITINARNLEHLFRRFKLSERAEVRIIGCKMYDLVKEIAPSIILFSDPSKLENNYHKFQQTNLSYKINYKKIKAKLEIIDHSHNSDNTILASLISVYNSIDYAQALTIVKNMGLNEQKKIFKNLFANFEFFDTPPREFELPYITFQALVSASCYAQLKRHRMSTLLCGDYNTMFGNTVPESIKINGLEQDFNKIIKATNSAYLRIKQKYDKDADYILTNSHRRMVIMRMNLRDLYHFTRLRDDEHAQWDIRDMAAQIRRKTKKIMPLSSLLLCGKSDFNREFEHLFARQPDVQI